MANKLSVAFIGTGIMGAPIAGHILDAGYPVTVNNRTKSKAAALVERGAVWADTPADAAANADVVFTMVGYPSEVEELYLAGDGLRPMCRHPNLRPTRPSPPMATPPITTATARRLVRRAPSPTMTSISSIASYW